jgi:hypothetical protein
MIKATLEFNGINHCRVRSDGDDWSICMQDGSRTRYYSKHYALTEKASIQLALSCYMDLKLLQKNISYSRYQTGFNWKR